MPGNKPRWFATFAVVALATYLAFVLLPGISLGPLEIRTRYAFVMLVAASAATVWWTGMVARRDRGRPRLLNLGALSLSLLLSLLAADALFAVWRGRSTLDPAALNIAYERASDPVMWHGELYPRTFYPTNQSFVLYKPGVALSGRTYGEYYEHRLLASRLLRDSVLEYRPVSYRINQHGLREDAGLADARVFALGDSYVFGYATDEGAIWPDLLEEEIGREVYNLGVSATGPRQHLQLLEYMLAAHADSLHIEHLLWMIYEGNDLENSYAELRPPTEPEDEREDDILNAMVELPRALREGSVLRSLLSGSLAFRARGRGSGITEVDGIQLRNPLYHSARWGYRLFNPVDILAATRDDAYVRKHRNSGALAAILRRLQQLARQHGFRVTVVLAPSDARLYGRMFEDMPPLNESPCFLNYVGDLASGLDFDVVNLAELMRPYAENELLYYRDDHHWNRRGNAVAAQLIAGSVKW